MLPLSNLLNFYTVPLLVVLLIFYGMAVVRQDIALSGSALILSVGMSVAVGLAALLGTYPINHGEIARLILLVWYIPYVAYLVGYWGIKRVSWVLVGVLLIHGGWGIAQFAVQHDLGLYRLGESRLSATTTAVAKFALGDQTHKVIRAYGPYPHANSLAGSLLLGMFVLVVVTRQHRTSFGTNALTVLLLGEILCFSRAALVGAFLLIIWAVYDVYRFRGQKWGLKAGILLGTFVVCAPLLLARATDPADQALTDRAQGYSWFLGLEKNLGWLRGAGPGNYKLALYDYLKAVHILFHPYQLDFVHSVPLLLLAEWGVVPILLVVGLVVWLVRRSQVPVYPLWWLVAVLALPIFLDHYFISQTAPVLYLMVTVSLLAQRPWVEGGQSAVPTHDGSFQYKPAP